MIKKITLPLFIIFVGINACTALTYPNAIYKTRDDSTKTTLQRSKIKLKLSKARHEFMSDNMRGALNIYRAILTEDPSNPLAHYRLAECYYELQKYNLALKYIEKAHGLNKEVDKDINYLLGRIYHSTEKIDEAISYFEKFKKESSKKTVQEYEIDFYLDQCKLAKEIMAKPVNVEINHLSRNVNTSHDEYTPSISANGKTMILTARRPDTQGGGIDIEGDHRYFEDVYITTWNEEDGDWELTQPISGKINTDGYDAVLSMSPDGSQIFIYKNNQKYAGDIFVSEKDKSGKWKKPVRLEKPINTSYYESSVTVTADQKTMYFVSERPNGFGQGDIYVSEVDENGKWNVPKNLGSKINSDRDEKFVYIHPSGELLLFASNGKNSMGGYDIFKCEWVNGKWTEPKNLGYPINTVNEESTFTLTGDMTKLYIGSEYKDSYGNRDIYEVDLSNYNFFK